MNVSDEGYCANWTWGGNRCAPKVAYWGHIKVIHVTVIRELSMSI